ncbi:TPA: phosphatidylglycerophosphatase A [Candidatus Dependentiae bacterium]|nr:MAG: Phosphatidylglycerophosphatase [candidate division TM6 bacterium GW2011_GWF2_36_131]KKQ03499.1 MAG: Phosphatidylglycerophosphatase [candidate division TM6 bacterium GW2011_GWE2_36_25]KKQ20227.1 MAG: Phosphatidylglycerophosphatase [candidate division TM6 bacterium GW2011_GWA2_36_9]HBR70766.1 phosphatidylglycerophosphatase A [Candidatus Dependentiae bacterium]HCU00151.1 phosphatidylglycerophosphatase A [Candidatus Dependentiae bacterium]
MTFLKKLILNCATLGPIGYLPASGSVATGCAFLMLWAASCVGLTSFYLFHSIVLIVGLSVFIIHAALKYFSHYDPPEIVLDEVIGYFFAASIFPLKVPWLIVVALIFRFFDILKPFGIRRLENLEGAAGIILDDLLAAFYTWITLILMCIGYDLWFR